jgi:hypothetical protein
MDNWTVTQHFKSIDLKISIFIRSRRTKPLSGVCLIGVLLDGCLAVTYFRERKLTIIGALLFHGPVREGKGWVQQAIAAKRNL